MSASRRWMSYLSPRALKETPIIRNRRSSYRIASPMTIWKATGPQLLLNVKNARSPSSSISRLLTPTFRHLSTSTNHPLPTPSSETTSEPTTASARLKQLFSRYGRHAIAVYFVLTVVDLSVTFVLVHTAGADKIALAKDWMMDQYHSLRYTPEEARQLADKAAEEALILKKEEGKLQVKENKSDWNFGSALFWTEFALAYGIHKTVLLPFRIGLTVAWTPKIVAWLTRRGWIGKGGVGRAAAHASDKMKTASKNASGKVKDMARGGSKGQ